MWTSRGQTVSINLFYSRHTCAQSGHCFVMLSEHRQRPCVTLVFRRKKYLSDNTHNINLLTNKMLDVMMEGRVSKC